MKKFSLTIKKIFSLIIVILLLFSYITDIKCQDNTISEVQPEQQEEITFKHNYIKVKYREDLVDIGNPRFEYLDTSRSSFIRGAWYDEDNNYMIINLKGTYYHYCGLPLKIWIDFKRADSFGTYYNKYIKGNYDCRCNYVPWYKDN